MRRLPALLIIFLVFALCIPATTSAKEARLTDNLPNNTAKKVVLDNGFIVILKEIPSSGLVSLDLKVRAGSVFEGEFSGSGISHFVEHMIFKGTPSRKAALIEKTIRSLGGVINGATTFDYTTFLITIPKEHLSDALNILSDSLFNAHIHPAEVQKERNVILKEIKLNRDDPMRKISRLLWSTVFERHPYRYPVIGYEELFCKLTREDLLRYHRKMYVPNNMVLVVVGDIERDSALEEIGRSFGAKNRASLQERALPQERPQSSKRTLEVERELQMAYFALGYRSVDVYNPDMPILDVLSAILGRGKNSRLNSSLYKKKGLVYSIGSWNYTPRDPGIFLISGVTESEKLRPALGAIKEEVNNIRRDGITEDELQHVKTILSVEYIYSLETLADQARDLAINEITTGDFGFTKKYLERIDAVTEEDVKRVAQQYLVDDTLSTVTLSLPTKDSSTKKKAVKSQRGIEISTLPNGLRYLLAEDHDLPTVSMVATCHGGLRAETKDTAGISNLTGRLMLKGTSTRSEDDISDLVDSMGAGLSYFSGNNSVGIRLNILSKDLDKGLDLFGDILLRPSFPADILERERKTIMAAIRATDDDIYQSGMKAFKETLYKTHPYRYKTIGTTDSVMNLTGENLKRFHRRYLIPNNMVLAIYGDINSAAVQEKIIDIFSDFEKGPEPAFTSAIEPEPTKIRENIIDVDKEQTFIVMGFKGTTIHNRDRYTLQAISTALSGISGRLSARLREDLGIAYAVGSFSVPAHDPGYFTLYIATTRDNIERVKKEFLRQIALLNKKGLTQEEIDSIKEELIGNQRIALQTNSSLAHHTALDELYGLGYNFYHKYDKIMRSITNNDIIEVSRKYFNPNAFCFVVIKGGSGS